MNLLESIAREHFNKRAGLGWAELNALFPDLYEFMAPETPPVGGMISSAQEDADRATSQKRGVGYVQQRGHQDSAMYVGPPVEAFTHARESCKDLREAMHQVLHLMALSVDNNTTALGRSAASKAQDNSTMEVVFGELGRRLKLHAVDLFDRVAQARNEEALVGTWKAEGACAYDAESDDAVIERAVQVSSIMSQPMIKSVTFRRDFQLKLAKAAMGEDADEKKIATYEKEIQVGVTEESIREEDAAPDLGDVEGAGNLGSSKMKPNG
jgi:hypothetical protein